MGNTAKTKEDLQKELEELKQIKWMLEKKPGDIPEKDEGIHDTGYGDLTELNKDGLILKYVGHDLLKNITSDYLKLLETSSAIYEINGDYAYGIFSSGWCKLLDKASRELCNTSDNKEALESGLWLCHESCWNDCAQRIIEEQKPIDVECNGGIRLYGVPIFAENNVIGVINFGYSDPPKDKKTLKEIASKYNLDYETLHKEALAYPSRPAFIIEMAKERLNISARIIGSIVENKMAENKVLWWKDLMENIIQHDPSAVAILDNHLNYLMVSRQYLNDYGLKRKNILGKNLFEVFPGNTEKWKEITQKALNGKVLNSEEDEYYREDGTLEYTTWECRPWYETNSKIGGIVLYSQLITQRKKTENKLKERIKELRCLYNIAELSNNPNIEPDEFYNKIIALIPASMGHPEMTGACLTLNGKTYKTDNFKNTKWMIKNHINIKNSKAGNLEVCFLGENNKTEKDPFLDDEKKMLNSIAAEMAKFFERKQIEKKLTVANKNLEELIYVASHDLQVPIISMEGYASELLERYNSKLDEEGKYCISRLKANAQRMHKLILSLLDLSRVSTSEMSFEKFSLNASIENIIKELSLTIEKAKANIITEKLPQLYADKQNIESVLRNTIINALKYNGKNIQIYYKDNVLSIKDDGIGVPPGQLERIFYPGERIKTIKVEGVGMGLTYCKKVIDRHKGKIWAESKGKNKGTTINIQFSKENLLSG